MQAIRVIIIGGGFSGAMTAYHLLKQNQVAFDITIVEPSIQSGKLGLGLAYSTTCDEHLLNVSAAGMSALADEPNHFLNYARAKDPTIRAEDFLPRKFFGQYVQELLTSEMADITEAKYNSAIRANFHSLTLVQQQAIDIEEMSQKLPFRILLNNDQPLEADIVVLALGNLSGKPGWLDKLPMTSAHYIHNPWNTEAIEAIDKNDSVLLVGTGLTAVDKIIELKARGHVGSITAASRHGLLPRRHLDKPELHPAQLGWSEISKFKLSALAALKLVRHHSAQAANWQGGVDSFRSVTQQWWSNLALSEKRNYMRHLQTYWDIHRHRMAPAIAAKIESYQTSGQLKVLSGGIKQMQERLEPVANTELALQAEKIAQEIARTRVEVTIQERHSKAQTILVDRVVNCTGPQAQLKYIESPLMANLHKRGLIAPDPTGAGINCEPSGKIIDSSGKSSNRLFAIGPLLKAVLLESVAVPELKGQAQALAELICTQQPHSI